MKTTTSRAISTVSRLSAGVLLTASLAAQNGSAVFEVTFTSTWSRTTHPVSFPSNPHFSPLIGGTHNAATRFWMPGGLATDGVEAMAERGSTGRLTNEINMAIAAGGAKSVIRGSGLGSPGSATVRFTADASHPQLSIVSMLAPSPDWFVGIAGLELMKGGRWIDRNTVDATLWDAGTDSGTSYNSANSNTSPQGRIAVISTSRAPFKGYSAVVGRWTVRRIASTKVYGCGVNPKGSMSVTRGAPLLGQSVTFAVDDPSNSMRRGSSAFLLFSLTSDPNFPCGTRIPGWGMNAGRDGELLIGSIFATLRGATWSGSSVEFTLSIPNDSGLIGASATVQGGLVGATRLGLADAAQIHLGR